LPGFTHADELTRLEEILPALVEFTAAATLRP